MAPAFSHSPLLSPPFFQPVAICELPHGEVYRANNWRGPLIHRPWGTEAFSPTAHKELNSANNRLSELSSWSSLSGAFRYDHSPTWYLDCNLVRELEVRPWLYSWTTQTVTLIIACRFQVINNSYHSFFIVDYLIIGPLWFDSHVFLLYLFTLIACQIFGIKKW